MKSVAAHPTPPTPGVRAPRWLAALPLLLAVAMLLCLPLARVRANGHLFLAIAGCGGGLIVWQVLLWFRAARTGVPLRIEPLPPVRQHYVQACVQICLYVYWGYWWQAADASRPIAAQAPLILVQFAWLYAFDALFAWTRGQPWRLGSGPTPIVLSTNLFIWFHDDWFVWQFVMVTAGLLGKVFVQWTKDGRRTHVFNPSGFGLACAATVLIATGKTDLTWAKPLASTIQDVPGIFLFLFGLGLVVQHFFAVTLMTFAAAGTMVAINLLYTQWTGVYLFASTNLPAAAFLGLHLLMTDPSTSPRRHLGRALFGAGYGLGYVVVFQLLGWLGAPELFAKLYPVPVLNCCVQWLDRLAQRGWPGRLNARWENAFAPRVGNAIHMAAWAAVFVALFASGYFRLDHPGNSIEFWKRAVQEGRHEAERKLVMVAGSMSVADPDPARSAAATNELGILALTTDVDPVSEKQRQASAANWFAQAAARGSAEAVENLVALFLYGHVHRSDAELDRALRALEAAAGRPGSTRACQLLGLAYETGAARPVDGKRALDLYRRCGDDVFAQKGIVRLGLAAGAMLDLSGVTPVLAAAAARGDGESCYYLAFCHERGLGVGRDVERARVMFARAAELGFPPAKGAALGADGVLPAWAPPPRKVLQRPPWSTAFPLAR